MQRIRAFTLLEVALIVGIIGMMLLMIVGYMLAPKEKGPLPPLPQPTPIPFSGVSAVTLPSVLTAPKATPAPAPATPVPTATPTQTIELSPQSAPLFR